jgi:hypothetical protein
VALALATSAPVIGDVIGGASIASAGMIGSSSLISDQNPEPVACLAAIFRFIRLFGDRRLATL